MIYIFGGGTVYHVRNHTALCAPAYGTTARKIYRELTSQGRGSRSLALELTRMAAGPSMETNADVAKRLAEVLADESTRAIVFNVAVCDVEGQIGDVPSGKYAQRLRSREAQLPMRLTAAEKLLQQVKKRRPDVFLVGFKTTAGESMAEQIWLSLRQIEETGADLVLANDTVTRSNLLISGGSTAGTIVRHTEDRDEILRTLAAQLLEATQSVEVA